MGVYSHRYVEERAKELVNDTRSYLLMKRLMDVIFSVIGIIVLFPIFIIIGIAIKLEDPRGPVMFTQERYGQYPSTFKMYKFRSMYVDAEERLKELQHLNEQSGPVFKIKHDPRITKVGEFIRRTSLDELPQLLNIVKGDMSIVGPRPPLPQEVLQYNNYHIQRLFVKPGLTCIWQTTGRNSIGFEEWVELDIEYIKKRSIVMDIKLILLTIPALFGSDEAS